MNAVAACSLRPAASALPASLIMYFFLVHAALPQQTSDSVVTIAVANDACTVARSGHISSTPMACSNVLAFLQHLGRERTGRRFAITLSGGTTFESALSVREALTSAGYESVGKWHAEPPDVSR